MTLCRLCIPKYKYHYSSENILKWIIVYYSFVNNKLSSFVISDTIFKKLFQGLCQCDTS